MVSGNVSRINSGLITVLSSPSTSAAIRAEPNEATVMPGRM